MRPCATWGAPREDAVREQRNGSHRLKALLLSDGIPHIGKSSWTATHRRWLSTVKFHHAAQQFAFQEYLHAITPVRASPGWSRP